LTGFGVFVGFQLLSAVQAVYTHVRYS